jgi:hypothetical protein
MLTGTSDRLSLIASQVLEFVDLFRSGPRCLEIDHKFDTDQRAADFCIFPGRGVSKVRLTQYVS